MPHPATVVRPAAPALAGVAAFLFTWGADSCLSRGRGTAPHRAGCRVRRLEEAARGDTLPPSPPRCYAAAGPHCRRRAKPIVWPGLCYTCATGLPRRLRGADERPAPPGALASGDAAIGQQG